MPSNIFDAITAANPDAGEVAAEHTTPTLLVIGADPTREEPQLLQHVTLPTDTDEAFGKAREFVVSGVTTEQIRPATPPQQEADGEHEPAPHPLADLPEFVTMLRETDALLSVLYNNLRAAHDPASAMTVYQLAVIMESTVEVLLQLHPWVRDHLTPAAEQQEPTQVLSQDRTTDEGWMFYDGATNNDGAAATGTRHTAGSDDEGYDVTLGTGSTG